MKPFKFCSLQSSQQPVHEYDCGVARLVAKQVNFLLMDHNPVRAYA